MASQISLEPLLAGLPLKEHGDVRRVFMYAKSHLTELARRSGESYFEHGCQVAMTVREVLSDPMLMRVCLLHDLPVHPQGANLLKQAPLSDDERKLVQEMNRLRHLHIDERMKDLDFVIDTFSRDARLLLMRMAHRLNDIRRLALFEPKIQRTIAHETLHMYTAIAGRLGFRAWRREMEDICFKRLQPTISQQLEDHFQQCRRLDETCLTHTQKFLLKAFKEKHITATIHGRRKGLYSTYRKMLLKHRSFEAVTDRLALRVLVGTLDDCYRALGIIHSTMHPISGKLKDYIGAPKENGYRSIHTVVYPLPGITEQPIEIQIRTADMHHECEYGLAAHDDYKRWNYSLNSSKTRIDLFRNLAILKKETHSPAQFATALRNYFQEGKLVIFDHTNHLYHLNQPATAMDFAILIYGERCRRLRSIRVNGRERPFDTPLHDGDVVEVRFCREHTLKKQWRIICYHQTAKQLIHKLGE